MARRRKAEQDDEQREVTRVEKASYWLAHAITFSIKAATDTTDPGFKRALERRKHDTQDTLALSLEAYALAAGDKDAVRADALIADLEIGPKGLRRATGGHHYFDLLETRRIGRGFHRDQEKRKKRIAALEKLGVRSQEQEVELKQLRAVMKSWEENGY